MDDPVFFYLIAFLSVCFFSWGVSSILTKPGKDEIKELQNPNEYDLVSPEEAPRFITALLPVASLLGKQIQKIAQKYIEKKNNNYFIRIRQRIIKSLIIGGNPSGLSADDFIGACITSCIGCGLIGWFTAHMGEYPAVVVVLASSILGFFIPLIWLRDQIQRRQIEIRREIPYMLDLLTLCVESGLDFSTALTRIVNRFKQTALAYELRVLLREIQMGKTRAEGLRDLSDRIGLMEMSTVVSAIIQAEQLGSSVGPTLRLQSEEARSRRSLRAEELAMKAPVKMLFPLIGFIFPTTFFIIFGPVVIKVLPNFI